MVYMYVRVAVSRLLFTVCYFGTHVSSSQYTAAASMQVMADAGMYVWLRPSLWLLLYMSCTGLSCPCSRGRGAGFVVCMLWSFISAAASYTAAAAGRAMVVKNISTFGVA